MPNKKPVDYSLRMKNPTRTTSKKVEQIDAYCSGCDFSATTIKDEPVMSRAKSHVAKTAHTVNIYKEYHYQITKYSKND